MNYSRAVNCLESLMMELMDKGVDVPAHLREELKSGRTMASVHSVEPANADVEEKIPPYLQLVEANLLSLYEAAFGKEATDDWQRRINAAYEDQTKEPAPAPVFVSGVPKGAYWVRIQREELPIGDQFDECLARYPLTAQPMEDGYLMIYGQKADVTGFLKEVRRAVSKAAIAQRAEAPSNETGESVVKAGG